MPGLMLVASPDDLVDQERRETEDYQQEERRQREAFETSLAGHVRRCWDSARRAKRPVEERILRNLRQRNGEYDPEERAMIQESGAPEIYMMLTAVKCRAAKSWIRDVLLPSGDRPFQVLPTPVPDLPQEVEVEVQQRVEADAQQFLAAGGQITPQMYQSVLERARSMFRQKLEDRAKQAAERLEEKIEDKLAEGRWQDEFDAVISDIVDFPAGIKKAPVTRLRERLTWGEGGVPQVERELVDEVERVDPLDFYPAAGISDVNDGDCIQRHRLTRGQLYDLIGLDDYDEESIREALREYDDGGLTGWEEQSLQSQVDAANDDDRSQLDDRRITALEFWGSVPGRTLIEWGMNEIEDGDRDYPVCCWLIGRHVIKAELNRDPMGRKPYHKASFEIVPGSFWGRGVPDLIRDSQKMVNSAARAMAVNMGLASGPQVVVDVNALPPGTDLTSMYPWKIWQLNWERGTTRVPIHFFQPNPMTDQLLKVYEHFSRQADETSGIPAYTYGSSHIGQAGRTASGLSMLMNAASKAIKNVISHIDNGIIVPVIRRMVDNVMQYEYDPEFAGDILIQAKGSLSLVHKEQVQMRRLEYLQQTMNPIDFQIMGPDGRAALHREVVKSLDIGPDEVIPDREELMHRLQGAQAQQQPQQQPPAELGPDGQPVGQPVGGPM